MEMSDSVKEHVRFTNKRMKHIDKTTCLSRQTQSQKNRSWLMSTVPAITADSSFISVDHIQISGNVFLNVIWELSFVTWRTKHLF